MTAVQEVFNDLLAWVKQSPSDGSPVNVVGFQHVTIAGGTPVGFAYGTFNSVTPISISGAFLTGSHEQAVSNVRYHEETGKWQSYEGSAIMTNYGSGNVRLQLATDHLLFTLSEGELRLNSVDERHFAFIGE